MKICLFVMCVSFFLPVQPQDMDNYSYCESCLMAVREMEKAMQDIPTGSRELVVEKLLRGQLCEKLQTYNHDHVPKEKLKSSCKHLIDSHYDKIHDALIKKEPKNLDIILCYELSHACVGVKRHAFEESKATFTETDIDALLQENKEKVCMAQPVHTGSPTHRDEL